MSYQTDDEKSLERQKFLFSENSSLQKDQLSLILSSYEGRSFYWRLLSRCGIFRTSFTGDNTTFFNEGMRQVGLWALEELFSASPEAFLLMQKEAKDLEDRQKAEMKATEEDI